MKNLSRYGTVHNLLLANRFPASEDGGKLPPSDSAGLASAKRGRESFFEITWDLSLAAGG